MHRRDGERAELFFYLNSRRSFYPERGAECRVSGGYLPSGAARLVHACGSRGWASIIYIFALPPFEVSAGRGRGIGFLADLYNRRRLDC